MPAKFTRMDFPELLLPDGTRADSLRLGPLYAALAEIGVPGLRAEMGKLELLQIYDRHVEQAREAVKYDPAEFLKATTQGRAGNV